MTLGLEQIASAITASRSEFNRLFLQAQVDIGRAVVERVLFEAVTGAGVDRDAFLDALRYAQNGGFLDLLIRRVVEGGLENGVITQALAHDAASAAADDDPNRAALQAMTNLAKGFQRPEVLFRGINGGMRWTVKVLIKGAPAGSGILIGPHLVLTGWHVLKSLFRWNGETKKYDADPSAYQDLAVAFDDLSGLLDGSSAPAGPTRVPAHKDWHVTHSPCHSAELNDKLPPNITDLEGWWDYAVIRLAKTPGLERRWATLDALATVPGPDSEIIVFQHPTGLPMRVDASVIVAGGAGTEQAIPNCRFLHQANALPGSSGGPCFDKTFLLFGIHQGEWKRGSGGNKINRGVPIVRIEQHIKTEIAALPSPDPAESPVWKLTDSDIPLPVIGCEKFQSLVWKSAVAGKPRLILLTGEPGSGKSFQLAILASMLPDSGHLKVLLDADEISKLDAISLAQQICTTAGAPVPTLVPAAEFNSTVSTWLRDELVHKMIEALNAVRNGRLVWFQIRNLNHTVIQGENASPLLLLLYEQIRTVDWLRVVLDGMKGDPPSAVKIITEYHRTEQATREDIEIYLRRAMAEVRIPVDETVGLTAKLAYGKYQRALTRDAQGALENLSEEVQEILGAYL